MNKMQDLPLCDLNEVKRTAKRTDSDISGCKFSGEYLESEDLSCLSFINCMFENCTFTDCDFERSSFVDVTFISCDLSNSSLDCSIQGVAFESSNCEYSIFDKCKLSETQVKNSDMSSAELVSCNLKAFKTSGSKYLGTSFFRTALGGVDFSTCLVSGLRVSDTFRELRNAVFSANQAVELSMLLGIRIK